RQPAGLQAGAPQAAIGRNDGTQGTHLLMKLSVYRFDPDKDERPYMKDYEVTPEASDRMLLDVLVRAKVQDDSLSFRRSCREGVCGSDAMNINGKNGLACITRVADPPQHVTLRPLPGPPGCCKPIGSSATGATG